MKILLTAASAWPAIGGIETSLHEIARVVVQLGHEPAVLSLQSESGYRTKSREGIRYIYLPYRTSRWTHQRQQRQMEAIVTGYPATLGSWRPDLVLSRSPATSLAMKRLFPSTRLWHLFATTARLSASGGYMCDASRPWLQRQLLRTFGVYDHIVRARLDRQVAENANLIVFSEFMKDQLVSEGVSPVERVSVIRPGVDLERFQPPSEIAAMRFRLRHNIPEEARVAVYVGRLGLQKNIHFLVDVMQQLEGMHLVMVGSGPEERRFRKRACDAGLIDRIHMSGPLNDELSVAYGMANVCVLPSRIESFGQTIVESLSCGTPVVAHGREPTAGLQTAADEILTAPELGCRVREYSIASFAKAVDKISLLPCDARQLLEHVRGQYSWQTFVRDWLVSAEAIVEAP